MREAHTFKANIIFLKSTANKNIINQRTRIQTRILIFKTYAKKFSLRHYAVLSVLGTSSVPSDSPIWIRSLDQTQACTCRLQMLIEAQLSENEQLA